MKSFGKRPEGLRLERMRASPRWAGEAFRNLHPIAPGLRDTTAPRPTLSDFLCGGERRVPRGAAARRRTRSRPGPAPPTPACAPPGSATRRCCSRSTACACSPIRSGGRAPRRRASPARSASSPCRCRCARCRRSTLVLVSHDHYDHLDYPTIRELARTDVPFVTSLGVGAHLEAWGVPAERITELDWWETAHAARTPS